MHKWGFFTMGILAGIIAVLLTAVVLQGREPMAYAAAPQTVDNTGSGLIVATGASTQNTNDILWVVFKRPAPKRAGADAKDIVAQKDERISVAAYKIDVNARQMKLAAVRDVSFDLDLLELGNDKPHVKDIVEELRKNAPKEPPGK
jgi:hypothetical protein